MKSSAFSSRRSGSSASTVLLVALMMATGIGTTASAQSIDPQPEPRSPTHAAPHNTLGHPGLKPLVKPGDRTCLQQTGSLIPPKKGHCLSVPGRSYSGEELRNTGTNDNARSLQMLDPSISRGH